MDTQIVTRLYGEKLNIWKEFLKGADLEPDGNIDSTVLIFDNGVLCATGSRKDNLLKCIAVAEDRQGEGLTAAILTELRKDAFSEGHRHLFLYTKPKNREMFSSLFFYPIAESENVLLMEDKKGGIAEFLAKLPSEDTEGVVGACVMNCNPFTLGHRYLIEKAASECDRVYVFVLSEDKSRFKFKDRIEMVRRGCADLKSVSVLPTGPYLISSATFPTYFLKERDKAPEAQCMLDIEIFTKYYVPKFKINRRYIGTEPNSALTDMYNCALIKNLPKHAVEVCTVERLEKNGAPVSASAVRELLDEGKISDAHALVPDSTFEYLQTNGLLK